MRIKFVVLTGILILLVFLFNTWGDKDEQVVFEPLELEIGSEFTQIKTDTPKYVLNYSFFDTTGNSRNDMVIAIGEKTEEEMQYKNIDLIIYDTQNQKFVNSNLKNYNGGMIKLTSADINADSVNEIIITSDNLDKTKNVRILKNNSGEILELFGEKQNRGVQVNGTFVDGFKAVINIKNFDKEISYNLDDYKENYISSGFFAENGKLISEKKTITTSSFNDIELIELSNSYGIKTTQKIKGFDNLDILDEIEVLWKYENGKWIICEAISTKQGNLLY